MRRDTVRLMQALFCPTLTAQEEACWRPAADVYRTPTGWLVKLDLSGVRPEEIEVEVWGSRLTVRGVRRDCSLEHGCRHYHMEIAYNEFERSLEIPCNLQRSAVESEYRDGMLLVHIRTETEK